MLKMLPLVVVVLIIAAASGYFIFFANERSSGPSAHTPTKPTNPNPKQALDQLKETTQLAPQSSADKITLLTAAVLELKTQLDEVKKDEQQLSAPITSDNEAIESLEDRIVNLQTQVTQLVSASTTTPAASTTVANAKLPVSYIPLGSDGQGANLDWYTLTNYAIQINPSDYPGYSSMQLEVGFRLSQQSGTGYARLFNVTDNSDVGISVQTTSSTSAWYQSYYFKPATGTKTYSLQIKSATGTEIIVQSARIRVNF